MNWRYHPERFLTPQRLSISNYLLSLLLQNFPVLHLGHYFFCSHLVITLIIPFFHLYYLLGNIYRLCSYSPDSFFLQRELILFPHSVYYMLGHNPSTVSFSCPPKHCLYFYNIIFNHGQESYIKLLKYNWIHVICSFSCSTEQGVRPRWYFQPPCHARTFMLNCTEFILVSKYHGEESFSHTAWMFPTGEKGGAEGKKFNRFLYQ